MIIKANGKKWKTENRAGKLVKDNFLFPPRRRAENLLKILFKKNVALVTLNGILLVLYWH
ncbi:MAG: hypothetical protein JXA81_15740 [Sedimentisphaerales bacterium]|nr:hypothetical protein [Sedimentisphaerales bacterium]